MKEPNRRRSVWRAGARVRTASSGGGAPLRATADAGLKRRAQASPACSTELCPRSSGTGERRRSAA
eukprot:10647013-Alexandrium_andersonii.AAC.1